MLYATAFAQPTTAPQKTDRREIGVSGLPLPRFVAIAKSEANVRQGPGLHFPLLWQYRHHYLPVEIIDEYGHWRRIRDYEGGEGWMHTRLLSGMRAVILRPTDTSHALRRAPRAQAGIVLFAQAGVVAHLQTCAQNWCKITINKTDGWLPWTALWGVYDFEAQDFERPKF